MYVRNMRNRIEETLSYVKSKDTYLIKENVKVLK